LGRPVRLGAPSCGELFISGGDTYFSTTAETYARTEGEKACDEAQEIGTARHTERRDGLSDGRDYAAIATPVTSVQVVNACGRYEIWRRCLGWISGCRHPAQRSDYPGSTKQEAA